MHRKILGMALLVGLIAGAPGGVLVADDKPGEGRLKHVQTLAMDELDAVVSAVFSPDGKYLYVSAWRAKAVSVFKRDARTGEIEHVQSIVEEGDLAGTTALALSADGKYAAAAAFQSQAVTLYNRDAETGKLEPLDIAAEGADGVEGLKFPINCAFSKDGKFLYVLDATGPDNQSGSLTAFRVTDDKLRFVEANSGEDGCFGNARGITMLPDGKAMLVASAVANALVVVDRDATTGKTTVRQVLRDEEGDVHALGGAMDVALSPDAKYAYVSSGRFSGDSAVSVFKFGDDGRLAVVQELFNEDADGPIVDWVGGNEIAVSPDGRNVYAVATRSGSLASFRRDPETGKLTFLETLTDGGDDGALTAAAGIGVSPDGKFVYVAVEEARSISVYRRDIEK